MGKRTAFPFLVPILLQCNKIIPVWPVAGYALLLRLLSGFCQMARLYSIEAGDERNAQCHQSTTTIVSALPNRLPD